MNPAPDLPAPSRWYVLAIMTAVYAMIADRIVMSTLVEPIRHELVLGDAGWVC